jgi:hypothetical protein
VVNKKHGAPGRQRDCILAIKAASGCNKSIRSDHLLTLRRYKRENVMTIREENYPYLHKTSATNATARRR